MGTLISSSEFRRQRGLKAVKEAQSRRNKIIHAPRAAVSETHDVRAISAQLALPKPPEPSVSHLEDIIEYNGAEMLPPELR